MSSIVALVLVVAVAVVVHNAAVTSSARVAAGTSTEGFLTAGTVVLTRPDDTARLLLTADGLYPGRVVRGCVEIDYAGSVPATIRLHGAASGGTGLDRFVDLTLSLLDDDACPTGEPSEDRPESTGDVFFDGRLRTLWHYHSDYDSGLVVAPSTWPGDRLVVEAVAVLADDDAAQGLTTDFAVTFEGRPT